MRIDGVDLSHYQDQKIGWAAAKKAGVKFLIHKATEGTGFVDGNYSRRRSEAAAHKVKFGAYHYAKPTKNGGTAQAKHFLSVAKLKKGDLLPVLDLEETGGLSEAELTVFVHDFFAECKKQLGDKRMILYTHFALPKLKGFKIKLWASRYSNTNAKPPIPPPHRTYAMRQFSDGKYGKPNNVPGIGHVDINHIRNGLHKLLWKKRLVLK